MQYLKQKRDGDYAYQSGETGDVIEVEVEYMKTDRLDRRGIYVRITKVTLEQHEGYTSKTIELFNGGVSAHAIRLERKNPKVLARAAELVDPVVGLAVSLFESGSRKEALALLLEHAKSAASIVAA